MGKWRSVRLLLASLFIARSILLLLLLLLRSESHALLANRAMAMVPYNSSNQKFETLILIGFLTPHLFIWSLFIIAFRCHSAVHSSSNSANADASSVVVVERDHQPSSDNTWKIKMLYDGDCPLCMREVWYSTLLHFTANPNPSVTALHMLLSVLNTQFVYSFSAHRKMPH